MVRYGGNTSCVEVIADDGTVVILDAGTGIRNATSAIDPSVRRMDILLTHFHMDHLQGLGFFRPLFDPEMEVHIWGPPSTTMTLHSRLSRYLSPPLFPVCIQDFACHLVLHDAPRGRYELAGVEVISDLICHPGPTMGYRIIDNGSSIAYLPDHEVLLGGAGFPCEPAWTSVFDICEGADVLLHDAQYDEEEYGQRVGWGHSTPYHAAAFARECGVGRLVTFHHDPNHDDDTLDRLAAEAAKEYGDALDIVGGKEGDVFEI
jgi:phosphoribosyl 1,2-cyclic phosphodiesterase